MLFIGVHQIRTSLQVRVTIKRSKYGDLKIWKWQKYLLMLKKSKGLINLALIDSRMDLEEATIQKKMMMIMRSHMFGTKKVQSDCWHFVILVMNLYVIS